MMTNTFTPHVGGVARSVESFTAEYRRLGHRVLVVAPIFDGTPPRERGVVRVPAIRRFNGSDFSVRLPIPGLLTRALDRFRPQLIHSHHPYFLGGTALCQAASRRLPLVFTHHTMYERYTHYVPGDSPSFKAFAAELATGYANLCARVIAPSESTAAILRARGVSTPIEIIATGIDIRRFARASGTAFRRSLGIPDDVFVVGHVGRLAPEKNLVFLAAALARFLKTTPRALLLVVGSGPSEAALRSTFDAGGLGGRLRLGGAVGGSRLAGAYHAMDVFAFASKSETQGMVLAEAMASGVPVVGLDAPGVREVVRDGVNGRLVEHEDAGLFSEALAWAASRTGAQRRELAQAARRTARRFSAARSARKALRVYQDVLQAQGPPPTADQDSAWAAARRKLAAEWDVWTNVAHAANTALKRVP